MKTILQLYKCNPVLAMVIHCIGFFLWAVTLILIMVIATVAFAA